MTNNIFSFLLKKIVALSLTYSLLMMSFCLAFNNDIDLESSILKIYNATSISEYYNLVADIPIKFINNIVFKKYFKNTGTKSEKKNSKENNKINYEDIFSIYNMEQNLRELISSSMSDNADFMPFQSLEKGNYIFNANKLYYLNSDTDCIKQFYNVSLHLARDDTSNILNNINKQIVKFCLL